MKRSDILEGFFEALRTDPSVLLIEDDLKARVIDLQEHLDAIVAERDAEQLAALKLESQLAAERKLTADLRRSLDAARDDLTRTRLQRDEYFAFSQGQAATIRALRAELEEARAANDARTAATPEAADVAAQRREIAALEETLDRVRARAARLSQALLTLAETCADERLRRDPLANDGVSRAFREARNAMRRSAAADEAPKAPCDV